MMNSSGMAMSNVTPIHQTRDDRKHADMLLRARREPGKFAKFIEHYNRFGLGGFEVKLSDGEWRNLAEGLTNE